MNRLVVAIAFMSPAVALAQPQPQADVEQEIVPDSIPDPSVAESTPAQVTPPAETKPDDQGDFEKVGSALGFQIVSGMEIETMTTTIDPITMMPTVETVKTQVPMIGIRKWGESSGLELGVLFRIVKEDNVDANMFLGGAAGYMKGLSTHKHMRVFGELMGGLGLLMTGEDGSDDTLMLFGRLAIGTEVRLGMVGLPHIGLTARIGAGLQVSSTGDDTTITLGTEGGENTSVRGLLETSVGFVYYL